MQTFIPITKSNFNRQAKADGTDKARFICESCKKQNVIIADGVCFKCYNTIDSEG